MPGSGPHRPSKSVGNATVPPVARPPKKRQRHASENHAKPKNKQPRFSSPCNSQRAVRSLAHARGILRQGISRGDLIPSGQDFDDHAQVAYGDRLDLQIIGMA